MLSCSQKYPFRNILKVACSENSRKFPRKIKHNFDVSVGKILELLICVVDSLDLHSAFHASRKNTE